MLSSNLVVPFIDKTFFDISYARKILKNYDDSLLSQMQSVNIENLILKEGLVIKAASITHDKSVHGMIVCGKSDIDLWNNGKGIYEAIFCQGKTIYIDELLLKPNMINRYRFTLAHELAHWLLHKKIVNKLAKERKLLPYLSCIERDINNEIIEKVEAACEWQANYLAGAILMPYLPLKNYCNNKALVHCNNKDILLREIEYLSTVYIVSIKAMYVRLRQLEYIKEIDFL